MGFGVLGLGFGVSTGLDLPWSSGTIKDLKSCGLAGFKLGGEFGLMVSFGFLGQFGAWGPEPYYGFL